MRELISLPRLASNPLILVRRKYSMTKQRQQQAFAGRKIPYQEHYPARLKQQSFPLSRVICGLILLIMTIINPPLLLANSRGVYHIVKEQEDLVMIVDAYMIPREIIIKANQLKPPFKLAAGDVIFLPTATRVIEVPKRKKPVAVAETKPRGQSVTVERPTIIKSPPPRQVAVTRAKEAAKEEAEQGNHKIVPAKNPTPPTATPVAKVSNVPKRKGAFITPLRGRVIANFGKQSNGMFYNGIRIAVTRKAPVVASNSGTVIYVGELKGYGYTVIMKHADGYATVYSNLGGVSINLNDVVKKGVIIGGTPNCVGKVNCYISFELRRHNKAINPRKALGI
ncbi:MAG: peptidoglycan DD-metalloendopeptidase family protein [Deltaproteobacteria bacterium]|nr:peptidoglycan DD-metalloendopeptidase family protein [Deltaproteobacteria bacterium]